MERKSIRMGLAVIALAVAFRLLGAGAPEAVAAVADRPEVASFLLYLETGRVVRLGDTPSPSQPSQTTQPVQATQAAEPAVPVFGPEDAQLVEITRLSSYPVDTQALLAAPLRWDLTQQEPTVLILHTHATESYTRASADSYTESSPYRTLDAQYNMLRVGQELARLLEEAGIGVIHDTTLHDHPSYNGAYSASRATVQSYLEQYPSIRMVLDIHRDAADLDGGGQLSTSAQVDGHPSSQLMMVVGTSAGGLTHDNWQENMSLAVKLHVWLEKTYPGITRPISFRSERFNQDLSPGAMLIEVGAAGDSLEEALTAVKALAAGILALSEGTVTEYSAS